LSALENPARRNSLLIRDYTLILLGAGINLTIAFGLAIQGVNMVAFPTRFPTQPEMLQGVELFFYPPYLTVTYLVIGIVYSVVASLTSRPKRLISPFFVQLATTALFAVALAYLILRLYVPTLGAFFFAFIVYGTLALALFFVVGRVQDSIVRYLVGLNGTKDDTSSVSMMIDARVERVLECLDQIKYTLQVDEEGEIAQNTYLYRTRHRERVQRFLVVCPDVDQNRTQLVMVSYELRQYGIEKTLGLIDDGNMRFAHLIRSFRNYQLKIPSNTIIEKHKRNTLLPASTLAYSYALGITESKFLSLRSAMPHYKAILIGIVALFGLTTALRVSNIIADDLYRTFLVFAALSIVFDFLPLMRFKRRRRFGR